MDHPYGMFGGVLLRRAKWELPLTHYPNGSPNHRSRSELESRPRPKSNAESRPAPLFGPATYAAIHCNGIQ